MYIIPNCIHCCHLFFFFVRKMARCASVCTVLHYSYKKTVLLIQIKLILIWIQHSSKI